MHDWKFYYFYNSSKFFSHSGNYKVHIPSWFHICGPLKSIPFFPLVCKPRDSRHWGGLIMFMCSLSPHCNASGIEKMHLLWYLLFLDNFPFPLGPKENPWWRNSYIGHSTKKGASRMGPESFSSLRWPPWALTLSRSVDLSLTSCIPLLLISQMPEQLALGLWRGVEQWSALESDLGSKVTVWSWTDRFHFLGLTCLMC